jgi:hypothetical protein
MLAGCSVVPVERKFPDVPKPLMESCPQLTLVNSDETKMSGVLTAVVENYTKYHECSMKVDSWIEWYKKQKENFEKVN